VFELIEGETLAARLERGALPTEELFDIGIQIARALANAHAAGIVYLDLKPANIVLTKTGAKLVDFALAQPLTEEGALVGTLPYMSPERLEGKEADARSDLFALGAVLYEMATGVRAFEGTSQASLIAAILREHPRPIHEITPLAPSGLDRVVRACMAKKPEERWQSASDLATSLGWARDDGPQK
jgi:serine/threonine protein kinase